MTRRKLLKRLLTRQQVLQRKYLLEETTIRAEGKSPLSYLLQGVQTSLVSIKVKKSILHRIPNTLSKSFRSFSIVPRVKGKKNELIDFSEFCSFFLCRSSRSSIKNSRPSPTGSTQPGSSLVERNSNGIKRNSILREHQVTVSSSNRNLHITSLFSCII